MKIRISEDASKMIKKIIDEKKYNSNKVRIFITGIG